MLGILSEISILSTYFRSNDTKIAPLINDSGEQLISKIMNSNYQNDDFCGSISPWFNAIDVHVGMITKSRNPIRIGRLVRTLLKEEYTDSNIEEFVNLYKSTYDVLGNAFKKFDIVENEESSDDEYESTHKFSKSGDETIIDSLDRTLGSSANYDTFVMDESTSFVLTTLLLIDKPNVTKSHDELLYIVKNSSKFGIHSGNNNASSSNTRCNSLLGKSFILFQTSLCFSILLII